MSSLRNAVKRVTHKERSQPQARTHLGILEKKKDYRERAKDFHRKEDRITAMKQKASARNPDEFYFGMQHTQVQDGQHKKTQKAQQKEFEETVGLDTVRIMKDQDLSYVRNQKSKDAKKVERLRATLHDLDGEPPAKRKHTIFVETKDDAKDFDVAQHFGTIPELAGRAFNRPRLETLKATALKAAGYGQEGEEDEGGHNKPTEKKLLQQTRLARKQARKVAKARGSAYAEMEARTKRIAKLTRAENHLVTEKLVSSTGRKRKIAAAVNGEPAQYKWRRKRMG
jgi:U3 small nucleolar RNA-associated protein 11